MAESTSARDPIRLLIYAMSGLVVLIGGFLIFLVWSVRAYDNEIPKAMRDCEKLVSLVKSVSEGKESVKKDKFKPEVPINFFYEQAEAAGIPRATIQDFKKLPEKKSPGYVEQPFSVSFKGPISRKQIAEFLYKVESNSPLVRSSDITMNLSDKAEDTSDEWTVRMTFATRMATTLQ